MHSTSDKSLTKPGSVWQICEKCGQPANWYSENSVSVNLCRRASERLVLTKYLVTCGRYFSRNKLAFVWLKWPELTIKGNSKESKVIVKHPAKSPSSAWLYIRSKVFHNACKLGGGVIHLIPPPWRKVSVSFHFCCVRLGNYEVQTDIFGR